MKKKQYWLLAAAVLLTACQKEAAVTETLPIETTASDDQKNAVENEDTADAEDDANESSKQHDTAKTNENVETDKKNSSTKSEGLTPLTVDTYVLYDGNWGEEGPIITVESADVYLLDDGYEALKEALTQYNESVWGEVQELYQSYLAEIQEELYPADMNFTIERSVDVTRADSRILSFVNRETEYMGGAHGSYYERGMTFDAETGNQLELSDVVTDYDAVYAQVLAHLEEEYEPEMFFADYEETLHDMFYEDSSDMVSNLEWCMDTEGLSFRFSPYVLGPWAAGLFEASISLEEHGELLKEEYHPHTVGSVKQLPLWQQFEADLNSDGTMETYHLSSDWSEEDYHSTFCLNQTKKGSDAVYVCEGGRYYGNFTDAYLLETKTKNYYLYVEFLAENDFRMLQIFELDVKNMDDGENVVLNYVGETHQSMYEHRILDTSKFALFNRMDVLGTYMGYRMYRIGEDGMPVSDDSIYTIASYAGEWAYAPVTTRDITVFMHEQDGVGRAEETIPAGTKIRVRKTDGETMAELELEDGRRCDIMLEREEDSFQWLINGVSEYECFENLPYAG